MFFRSLGLKLQADAEKRAAEANRRIGEAMADRRELNQLQSEYRDWVKPPKFEKIAGRWYAVIEYGPGVPVVRRRLTTTKP